MLNLNLHFLNNNEKLSFISRLGYKYKIELSLNLSWRYILFISEVIGFKLEYIVVKNSLFLLIIIYSLK